MTSYEFSYVMEEGLALLPGLLSMIPSGALGIATYILTALSLYTLAQRRGINHPWLSWVPVANVWILGSLSDQYRYVVRGENKSKRKTLLVLNILFALITTAIVVLAIAVAVNIVSAAMYGMNADAVANDLVGPVLAIAGLALPLAGVSVAMMIIRYMALYDLYTSCDPGNNVLFLVLSILFHVTEPFFLLFSRNKDMGMPPRRQESAYIPYQEPQWQPPEEPQQNPWEENKDYL